VRGLDAVFACAGTVVLGAPVELQFRDGKAIRVVAVEGWRRGDLGKRLMKSRSRTWPGIRAAISEAVSGAGDCDWAVALPGASEDLAQHLGIEIQAFGAPPFSKCRPYRHRFGKDSSPRRQISCAMSVQKPWPQ
jgi:hypothetical protein